MFFLIQSSIMFAVIASNIHWEWTPNPYVASLIGIVLAYVATALLSQYRVGREHRGEQRLGRGV